MPRVAKPYIDEALEALAHRVTQWQAANASDAKSIPPQLWDEAAEVSRRLPLSRVAKRLRLHAGELRRHRDRRPGQLEPCRRRPAAATSVSFVEAVGAKAEAAPGTELEIQRPDGSRLCLRHPSDPLVSAILHAFLAR